MNIRKGKYFAVCCTSARATEAVNLALESQKNPFLVVITDSNQQYRHPTSPPIEPFTPPFSDQSPEQCWRTLCSVIERTASDLDSEMFALMDDRSAEDSSALLVLAVPPDGEDGELEVETVRVDLRLVSSILATWMAKGDNVPELESQAARSGDGVVRR